MTQTAKNYADALYELASDEGLAEEIYPQINEIGLLFHGNPDYPKLLSAPNIGLSERLSILDQAFSGRVHRYVLSFLKLLCEQGHIRELPTCVERFNARYDEDRGIVHIKVTTAVPLTRDQKARIHKRMCAYTGKSVEESYRVDPAVLGGIRMEYDGKELDGTVRQRLEGLRKTLSDTVL